MKRPSTRKNITLTQISDQDAHYDRAPYFVGIKGIFKIRRARDYNSIYYNANARKEDLPEDGWLSGRFIPDEPIWIGLDLYEDVYFHRCKISNMKGIEFDYIMSDGIKFYND